MVARLKSLSRELGAEVKFLRSPLLPTKTNSEKPDVYVKILNTVYLIRLYSGRNKHHMVHFSSERFSVRYMKMAMRMLASSKRRATGLAYVESGKAFTVHSKVFVSSPMKAPSDLVGDGDHVEMILLFNPAPHAVSVVLPEKTGIKVTYTFFNSNEEMLSKLSAVNGGDYDIILAFIEIVNTTAIILI